MVREICRDEVFLAQKAEAATETDLQVAEDLLETLIAHKDGCVGMAANMIGVNKRIIAFDNDGEYMMMFNPEIVKSPIRMTRRRGACPSPAPERRSAGSPLKCGIRTSPFGSALKPLPAGRRRLSSTKSTTARGSSSDR